MYTRLKCEEKAHSSTLGLAGVAILPPRRLEEAVLVALAKTVPDADSYVDCLSLVAAGGKKAGPGLRLRASRGVRAENEELHIH